MPVTLRALARAHVPAVVELIRPTAERMLVEAGASQTEAAARVARLKGPSQIRAMLERPHPDALFGAFREDGLLVGVGGVRVDGPGSAEMHTVYFAPEAQGLGLGRLLQVHRIEYARDAGLDRLHLRTASNNVRIQALAASNGFVKVGERPSESMPGVLWELWQLDELRSWRRPEPLSVPA